MNYNVKKAFSIILSLSLLISSIPAELLANSFLAPPRGIDFEIEKSLSTGNMSRRKFMLNMIAVTAFMQLSKTTPLMASGSNNNSPKMISLKDEVTQEELHIYRLPKMFIPEVETFYDFLAWQEKLAASGKPVEFGPGYIYHGWNNLDDAIIEGKVTAEETVAKWRSRTKGKDHILRSYLTRLPHKWATFFMKDPDASSPAIYMIHTKEFNKLVDEGNASLDYNEEERKNSIDPFPNIFGSFSLDIVSEIWVRDNDYNRYKKLINMSDKEVKQLSKREKTLRENLMPLFKKGILKPIPLLSHEILKKETDESKRAPYPGDCIALWMAQRGLFDKIPVFKAKDEPLPKNEPLTPREALLKFMSDLPKDFPKEDIMKRYENNENRKSMIIVLLILPYSSSLFKNPSHIVNLWKHTLKTPREIEARAKEILEDDELVRLFMLIKRSSKKDFELEKLVFKSEDARLAIKSFIRKDFGVNILTKNIIRTQIINGLTDKNMKDAMISFISALEPEILMTSPLCFKEIKDSDKLTTMEAYLHLDKQLASVVFWKEFLPVYKILLNRGYSSEKAGKLLADWGCYIGNVFNEIGMSNLLKDPSSIENDMVTELIAEELIRRRRLFFKYKMTDYISYISYLGISVLSLVLFTKIWRYRSINNRKIKYFRNAIHEELPKIEELLKNRHIRKLVNLSNLNKDKIMSILADIYTGRIKLSSADCRVIIKIIKRMRSESKDNKDTSPIIPNKFTLTSTHESM